MYARVSCTNLEWRFKARKTLQFMVLLLFLDTFPFAPYKLFRFAAIVYPTATSVENKYKLMNARIRLFTWNIYTRQLRRNIIYKTAQAYPLYFL